MTDKIIAETSRLIIGEIPLSDAESYRQIVLGCPEAFQSGILSEAGVSGDSLYDSASDAFGFVNRHHAYIKYQYGFYGYGIWGLYKKDTGCMIGVAGVFNSDESEIGEIGYALLPEYRCMGYAREAVKEIVEYSLEDIGFLGLVAHIDSRNTASLGVVNALPVTVITNKY